jgi:hypothetical protein
MLARSVSGVLVRFLFLSLTVLFGAAPASAQFDSAQVSGAIQDSSGAVLPGVDVVLLNEATRLERRAVTNESGLYTFVNVPVGDYRINATLDGFKPIARTGVRVNAGVNIRVDMSLEIGGLTETVQVSAATTLVDTSVIGRTVSAAVIAETPLSSRRATQVAQLVPGTVGGNLGGLPAPVNTFNTGIQSINGGRSEEFITTVDGAPSIRVRANGGFTMGMQNADTVEEVQVLTTNYQAEHGRASAGLLKLVTKSGGQQFRGNMFWTLQDDSLNANTWTNNRAGIAKSPSNFNQYGFTLGGPVYIPGGFNSDKSKLFFFWGEEWDRIRSVENQQAAVPSLAMRNGDFSELLGANPYTGNARIIRDPLTGLPFPGNIIPRDRLSPNGIALLNSYPLPTPGFRQGTNNWIGTPATFDDTRKDSIKIDFVPTSNHRIAVRHTWAPHVWNDPETAQAFSSIWNYPGRTMAATHTATLSNSLINEFTFSYGSTKPARFFGQRNCDYCPGGTDLVPYPTRASIGLNYPFMFPGTKLDPDKLSNLTIQNFTTLTLNQYPGYWYDFVFLWSDNVTKIKGNHTFKAGLSVERSGMKDQIQLSAAAAPATTNQNGSFRFTDARSGSPSSGMALSNAILGLFDDYTEFGTKPLTNFIGMGYDFYGQDSWKLTRQLTLELGLRYSLWQQWRDENNAIASFQSEFYDPSRAVTIDRAVGFVVPGSGDQFNGIVLPGDGPTDEALRLFPQLGSLSRLYRGVDPGFAPDPKDGLQPRLGMAFAVNDGMTIRGGVGRFLNRPQINTTAAYGFNPPLSEMATVISGNVDAPAGAERRTFPLVMAMFSPDYANASSWAWNVTADRQLPWQHGVQLSYVGRSASNLERARNINQLQPGTTQANPGVNVNALRPYKGFGSITLYETTGHSKYNAMQLAVNRRSTRGLGYQLAYTLSRTTDDGSARTELLPNAFDDSGYYGISALDRPHILIAQASYRTPELSGAPNVVKGLLGDWALGGVFQAQSGVPFDVTAPAGVDPAGVGAGSGNQYYNIVGDIRAGRTEFDGTRAVWFNPCTAANVATCVVQGLAPGFAAPANGTYATTWERNNLRQPGFWDLHMSLRKSVSVGGSHRAELRWDVFNVLNRPTLGNASTNPTAADFGTITSKTGSRTMQIGLQYIF